MKSVPIPTINKIFREIKQQPPTSGRTIPTTANLMTTIHQMKRQLIKKLSLHLPYKGRIDNNIIKSMKKSV